MHKTLKNRAGQIKREKAEERMPWAEGNGELGVTANGTGLLHGMTMFHN